MACSIRSQALMPPATWTKTTGEIGRKVPVLRNNMVKGTRERRRDRNGHADHLHPLSLTGQEADSVINPGQGDAGHIPGPLGPFSEYAVKPGRVSQQSEGAITIWRSGVDDDLGDVLLEVAVTSALVVGLQ